MRPQNLLPGAAGSAASRARRMWRGRGAFLAPALFVWPVLLYILAALDAWGVFATHYLMAVVMVFGSIVAGASAMGGGSVAFPVISLVLELSAGDARDFSLLVQAVGMTSAAAVILGRTALPAEPLLRGVLFATLGFLTGRACVRLDSQLVKTFFSSFVFAFGMLLVTFWVLSCDCGAKAGGMPGAAAAEAKEEAPARPPEKKGLAAAAAGAPAEAPLLRLTARQTVTLALVSFAGGIVSSLLGNGSDVVLYVCLHMQMGVPDHVAVPMSVVTMAAVSVMGSVVRLAEGDVSPEIIKYWLAAAGVVCVGAPMGTTFVTPENERPLRVFLILLIVLQYASAWVIVIHAALSRIILSVAVTLLGAAGSAALVKHAGHRQPARQRSGRAPAGDAGDAGRV